MITINFCCCCWKYVHAHLHQLLAYLFPVAAWSAVGSNTVLPHVIAHVHVVAAVFSFWALVSTGIIID